MCALALALLLMVMQIGISSAFLPPNSNSVDHHHRPHLREISTSKKKYAAASEDSIYESEDCKKEGLALPPIGASSFWDRPQDNSTYVCTSENSDRARPKSIKNLENGIIISSAHANLVSSKFQLQYTCKICGYRNSHMVTRMAYRKGVVIAMCKGCMTKHWIADHLGWSNHIGGFDFDHGERDIEIYMKNRDQEADGEKGGDLVQRVSQEVFDLEKILYKGQNDNQSSAKSTDEDGDRKSWRTKSYE